MEFKKVPKMDIDFSAIGYGCWGASGKGSWSGHSDENQIAAIHAAIDGGINLFDVAPVYGLGNAENLLGKAIKDKRNQVIIATKCGLTWDKNGNVINDTTEKNILKEIDDSLQRLGVDYVDLYQVHWPTNNGVSIEETMEAMNQIKKSGKARYIGLTNFSVEQVEEAMKYGDIASVQGLYNMIERNPESYHGIELSYRTEKEILPFVNKHGMAFLPYSPLFQGMLTGEFNKDTKFSEKDVRNSNPKLVGDNFFKYLELVGKIKEMVKELEKPMVQVALNWLVHQKEVSSVIAGVSNPSQIESNLKALEWKLPQELFNSINKLVDQYER